jgi:hypothetical protein
MFEGGDCVATRSRSQSWTEGGSEAREVIQDMTLMSVAESLRDSGFIG